MPLSYDYGSTWHRWDLHVHSPASALNNQFAGANDEDRWEKYLSRLEALPGVSALGITDYCSVDGYLRVAAERANGRVSNVDFVFPNAEFRILPVTGEARAINIHVLACPSIAAELEPMLFSNLKFEYQGNTYSCTRFDLIRLGRAVLGDPNAHDETAYQTGVNQFKTDIGQIRAALRTNKRLRDHCLVVVPNRSADGNSGLQESSLLATRQEIYRLSHAIFSSNPNDRAYFLGQGIDSADVVVGKCGALKPCVHGSDAHDLEKIGEPDQQRYTWIKADPTFEGLKQICYEPEFRVRIGPTRPLEPFHRLNKLSISLPPNSRIVSDDFQDQFCFGGNYSIHFAPGLTCIIGGRGSGKSTLLHLLQEVLTGESSFFRRNRVTAGDKPLDLSDYLDVDLVGAPEAVEFLTQNEVENFAVDQERLTKAIYTRLKRLDADDQLSEIENRVQTQIKSTDELIRLLIEQKRLASAVSALDAEIATNENLVQSLQDDLYKSLTARAEGIAFEQATLRSGRTRLMQLVSSVESAVLADQSRAISSSAYEERRESFVGAVMAAVVAARAEGALDLPDSRERRLAEDAAAVEAELQKYLQERQISPENVKDISRASSRLATLRQERATLHEDLARISEAQAGIAVDRGIVADYERQLLTHVGPVNDRLEQMGLEVARIQLHYRFDNEAAREFLLEQLVEQLSSISEGARAPRIDHIGTVMSEIDLLHLPPKDDLLAALSSSKAGTKTVQLVLDYFQDSITYQEFVLRSTRVALDVARFRRLSILYDGKPLQNASFGQRCSAALILLLTLGNTPIVIDEPEAHLDSALIANLLVVLIKRIKDARQIIFSTHNANFVVNGDSELIHILDMDPSRRTRISSATLEDVENRPRVLALEGGEKAFQQREERYGLRGLLE